MYPAPFRYLRPRSLSEAEEMFDRSADARYLAGGQSLIPAMRQRLASPSDVIDLSGVLHPGIRKDGGALVISAGTSHADVANSPEARALIPALAALAGLIGDPAVRHRGTIGGSLANNDPAADYPAAVLALNATVTTNRRRLGAEHFFKGMFETALQPGEIITEVSFLQPRRAAYRKYPNPASRFAMPGVFVAEGEGGIRVAVTGAASCVYREHALELSLSQRFSPDAITGRHISQDELASDLFASAEYRANLIKVMARRAVEDMI